MHYSTQCSIGVPAHGQGWSKQELIHFRRVASAMTQELGLAVEIDGGVTDEGEPWLVFCDLYSGEVVAHFARINGKYVACAWFLSGSLTGRVFPELITRFIACCPRRRAVRFRSRGNTGREQRLAPELVLTFVNISER